MMWYSSIFGNRRYKWIFKEIENGCYYAITAQDRLIIYKNIIKILNSWDPTETKEIKHLYHTINIIRPDVPVFSQDIICRCIDDLDNKNVFDYYTAWYIVFLMLNRMKPSESTGCTLFCIGTKYMLFENMERIVELLPRQPNKKRFAPYTENPIPQEDRLWYILYIMATAYNKIKTDTVIKIPDKVHYYLSFLEPTVILVEPSAEDYRQSMR